MKKFIVGVVSILLIICCFCSCKTTENSDQTKLFSTVANSADKNVQSDINSLLKSYFSYYEKGDYENMKQYCSDDFIKNYFHDKDVFGSAKSTLLKIDNSIKYDQEKGKYLVSVEEKVIPVKSSAYYDKEKSQVDVINDYIIKENGKGKLVIDSVTSDSTIY